MCRSRGRRGIYVLFALFLAERAYSSLFFFCHSFLFAIVHGQGKVSLFGSFRSMVLAIFVGSPVALSCRGVVNFGFVVWFWPVVFGGVWIGGFFPRGGSFLGILCFVERSHKMVINQYKGGKRFTGCIVLLRNCCSMIMVRVDIFRCIFSLCRDGSALDLSVGRFWPKSLPF